MINLQFLYLNNNQLVTIPKNIGNLINLQTLDLSHNQLISLPASITNLANLQTLDLYSQEATLLPRKLFTLPTFTLTSPITVMGEVVAPNSGTGNYTINGMDITWINLIKDITSVEFTFSKIITMGDVSSDFSGL